VCSSDVSHCFPQIAATADPVDYGSLPPQQPSLIQLFDYALRPLRWLAYLSGDPDAQALMPVNADPARLLTQLQQVW